MSGRKSASRHGARRQAAFINRRLGELRRLFQYRGMARWEADAEIAAFGDLSAWSADALGNHVGLTFAEKLALDIRTIRCTDKTPEEVAEFYANRRLERRRERDRQYQQERRDRLAFAADLDVRREALLSVIGTKPVSVPQIIRAAAHWQCWTMPNGKRLNGPEKEAGRAFGCGENANGQLAKLPQNLNGQTDSQKNRVVNTEETLMKWALENGQSCPKPTHFPRRQHKRITYVDAC
jgi:hypothetical protein